MEFLKLFKKEKVKDEISYFIEADASYGSLVQPIEGNVIPLREIGDGVFSEGIMGIGCGIIPKDNKVYAPCDGTVTVIADTRHAIGIERKDGTEVLIHVGLETVSMNGEGFKLYVNQGEQVKAGQLLMSFSIEEIEATEGVSTTSAFLITSQAEPGEVKLLHTGQSKAGEALLFCGAGMSNVIR